MIQLLRFILQACEARSKVVLKIDEVQDFNRLV